MTPISLVHDALTRGRGDVRAAGVLLEEAASSARVQVRSLEAGWHGVAADAFFDAFAEWHRAATACLDELRRLGDGMAAAQASLAESDASASAAAGALLAEVAS